MQRRSFHALLQKEVLSPLFVIAVVDALVLFGIAIFQVLLASGKPWGLYARGGNHPGRLPKNLRIGSAVSSVIFLLVGSVVLIEGGVIIPDWKTGATNGVTWGLAVMLARCCGKRSFAQQQRAKALGTGFCYCERFDVCCGDCWLGKVITLDGCGSSLHHVLHL